MSEQALDIQPGAAEPALDIQPGAAAEGPDAAVPNLGVLRPPNAAAQAAELQRPEADAFRIAAERGLGASGDEVSDEDNAEHARQIARDAALATHKATASGLSPDQGAEALQHSEATGLGPGYVAQNLDAVKDAADKASVRTALSTAPITSSWMAQSAAHAAAAKDSTDELSFLEWLGGKYERVPVKQQPEAFATAGIDYPLPQTTAGEMLIPPSWQSHWAKGMLALRASLLGIKRDLPFEREQTSLSDLITGREPQRTGLTKQDQLNLQQAEEGATAPVPGEEGHIVREAVGASIEALPQMAGFLIGAPAFLLAQTYGSLRNHFSEAKNDDGSQKYTEAQSRSLSAAWATATTVALGGAASKLAGGTVGKLLPKSAQRAIGSTATDALLDLAANSGELGAQLVAHGARFGQAALHGLMFMVGLGVANDLADQGGNLLTGGKYDAGRTWQAAKESAKGAAMILPLMAVGPAAGIFRDVGRAWKAHTDAADLASGIEAAKEAKILKVAPEQVQPLIDAQAQQDPARSTTFIPVAAFDAAMAAAEHDPAEVANALKDEGAAYQEAKATGGDVAIPTGEVLGKLAPNGLADALIPDAKIDADPEAISLRQAQQIDLSKMTEALDKETARAFYASLPGEGGVSMPLAGELSREQLAKNYSATPEEVDESLGPQAKTRPGLPRNTPPAEASTPPTTAPNDLERFIAEARNAPAVTEAAQVYEQVMRRVAKAAGITPEELAAKYPMSIGQGGAGERFLQDRAVGPLWHSTLENAAISAKQAKGTPESWLAVLSKSPGVKAEEIQETGVKEWLSQQKGVITREQVADFIKQHRVELQEKELGDVLSGVDVPSSHYESYTAGVHKPGTYRELLLTSPAAKDYSAPHFGSDSEGIIAHARIGETTDAQGRKVMMVEEIQSDLHQEGRSKGYGKDAESMAKARTRYDRAEAVIGDWIDENVKSAERNIAITRLTQNDLRAMGAPDEVVAELPELMLAQGEMHQVSERPPDVPWKDTWEELMVRRLVRYAAEHGFERIALTPGSVHTERYGTEEIAWERMPFRPVTAADVRVEPSATTGQWMALASDGRILPLQEAGAEGARPSNDDAAKALNAEGGRFRVAATTQRGGHAGGVDIEAEARRRALLSDYTEVTQTKEDLRSVLTKLGKENLTDKLWDRMQKEDTGISRPRAEGFEQAYDKRLKGAFDKQLKKYGGKMETEAVASDQGRASGEARAAFEKAYEEARVARVAAMDERATLPADRAMWGPGDKLRFEAMESDLAAKERALDEAMANEKNAGISAHVADLPPALAQKVLSEGQPLFQQPVPGALAVAGQERGSIVIGPKTDKGRALTINLNQPDESTLAHEIWHGLSVMLGDLAGEKDAAKEIVDLHERLAKELGYSNGSERQVKLDPAKEEGGASAFEQYLFEGKAPTPELAGVFAKFKEWLTRIYTQVRGGLTDEMRSIFDNILGKPQETEALQTQPAPSAERVRADSVKAFAERRLQSEVPLGKVYPENYRMQAEAAERRAVEAGIRGGKEGVRAGQDAAANPQANVAVNRAFEKVARDAKDAQKKIEGYLRDAAGDDRRAELAKAHPDLLSGYDSILQAVGADKRSLRTLDVEPMLQRMDALDAPVEFDVDALRDLIQNPRPISGLTLDEAQNVRDALTNLRAAARDINRFEAGQIRAALRETVAMVRDHNGGIPSERLPSPGNAPPPHGSELRKTVIGLRAELTHDELLINKVFGPEVGKNIWREYMAGKEYEEKLSETVAKPIAEARGAMPKALKDSALDGVDGVPTRWLDSRRWVRQDIRELLAQAGTESGMQRLTGGLGITEADVHRAIDQLTKEELDYQQKIGEVHDKVLWPLLAAHAAERSGLEPPKLELKPITTQHGTYPGWYAHAGYNREATLRAIATFGGEAGAPASAEAKRLVAAGNSAAVSSPKSITSIADYWGDLRRGAASVRSGFLKSRVQRFFAVPDLNADLQGSNVSAQIQYLAYDKYVRNLGKLLRDPELRGIVTEKWGEDVLHQLDSHLMTAARGTAEPVTSGARRWNNLVGGSFIRRVAAGTFTLNPRVAASLLSHIPGGMIKLRMLTEAPVATIAGTAKAAAGVAAGVVPDWALKIMPEAIGETLKPWQWKAAREESFSVRERWDHLPEQMRELLLPGSAAKRGPVGHAWDAMSWMMYRFFDHLSTQAFYQAGKIRAAREGASPAQAIEAGGDLVRLAMPPLKAAERGSFARDRGLLGALWLARNFRATSFNWTEWNAWQSQAGLDQDASGWKAIADRVGPYGKAAAYVVGGNLALFGIGHYMLGHGKRDDENWGQYLARRAQAAVFGDVPIVDEVTAKLADAAVSNKPFSQAMREHGGFGHVASMALLGRSLDDIGMALDKGKPLEDRAAKAMELALWLGGGPAALMPTFKYGYDVASGRENPRGPGQFLSGVGYGKHKHQESNFFSDMARARGE